MTKDIDITEAERILHEEEQKEIWKEYAKDNQELRSAMSKLYEEKPALHPSIKPAQFNLMLERERMNNSWPMIKGEVSVLTTLWGSGLGVSLGYLALLGSIIWYHINYMVP